ncbi:MAG: SPOR domain-containing protein [Bacteroidales bacterium]|nr:SPOR domain-containing protein [Bacteroidales bacterium]
MTFSRAYTIRTTEGGMRSFPLNIGRPVTILILLFLMAGLSAQEEPQYDEIPIYLEVPRIGGMEMTAAIKGETIYLPITDLFDFLKIRNIPAPDLVSVSGFFINPAAAYTISRKGNLIEYQDEVTYLEPGDLIRSESNLYMKSDLFGSIFGLECIFTFRTLTVRINTHLELPLIREMKLEEMRKNLNLIRGEVKADSVIGRDYPLFKAGVADWSVIATENIKGTSDARINLALGAMIAGGEATASLNYNSLMPFTHKQQYYQWRYVNNDFSPVRQIMLGKIASQATSSLYNPVVGVQFTNTPTTYRRSFGTYTLSDKTEPGWIVELYVNNVLVDYVTADASGFFRFEVPLVYGNSIVQLKFFGPWGEERTREQNINIPYNFLPAGTVEYKVSAGVVEDSLASFFSRAAVNYGVSRTFTAGAGIEYLSSVSSGPAMPYLNASVSLFNNLLLSGEYTYGVRTKGTLNYRLPSNLQFDINYTVYDKDQKAINYNYLEERRAILSMPVRFGKFSTFQRISVNQLILPASRFTTGEWLFSGSFRGVGTNLTTHAIFNENSDPNIYSNLSLALRMKGGLLIMPQAQYGFTRKEFYSFKTSLQKYVLTNGHLTLSYEHNFISNMNLAELGFRYDFSFGQAGASVRLLDRRTSLVQYARGSLIYDRNSKYLGADNRMNVGKGSIAVVPYLDLNANGLKDAGEPKAYGLNLRANGGRILKSDSDTTIRIIGLEPYTECFIELDPDSFEDISWRLPHNSISVAVDPNVMKLVDIPVRIVGEATGIITIARQGRESGLGRVIVNIFDVTNRLAGKTLSEDDGYYSYFGLTPGRYWAAIDTAQMRKLNMISYPDFIPFAISGGRDGDIITGLNFTLREMPGDSTVADTVIAVVPPVTRKDTTYMVVHEVVEELVTISEDSWAIQLGAFRVRSNAENLRRSLEKQLGRKVDIIVENDFFKVRINEIPERSEVDGIIEVLRKNGVTELWVISLRAKQQQLVLTEKQDTIATITEIVVDQPEIAVTRESALQVGAFLREPYAIALRDKLSVMIDKKVFIVEEDGYFKVRVSGFANREEMEKYIPSLGLMGMKDIWLLPEKKEPVDTAAVVTRVPVVVTEKPDTLQKKEEVKQEVKQEKVVVEPEPEPEPTVAIQAGVYYKRIQAIRAQKKIERKLDLKVEIVQQWEAYRVIITGFFTREEAFRYYPELAGLGFQQISLIEK